jgi:hypothetical protein
VLDTRTWLAPASAATRADVDGDAADIVADHFALAGMQPGSDLDAERLDFLDDGAGATNATRGTVESREKSVAGGLDFVHPSLRGALATKQSSGRVLWPLGCFASLAMTGGAVISKRTLTGCVDYFAELFFLKIRIRVMLKIRFARITQLLPSSPP